MKYFTLILIILFPDLVIGQTNVYHSFPEGNAVWNINYSLYCFSAGTASENYSIEMVNDTVINFITYHALKTYYVESFSTGTCGTTGGHVYIYRGAVRQDTSLKKVFIVPPYSSNEELLYDFNMSVGDTVRGYLERYPTVVNADIVISIDSILVGSQYRKKWNINQGYDISIIEGIGCTYGLTEQSPRNGVDLPGYNITCFLENGITIYPDSNVTCELINKINSCPMVEKTFTISPNPCSGIIRIKPNSTSLSKIELLNIYGQSLLTKNINSENEFNLEQLIPGIYFVIGYDLYGRIYYPVKLICK